MAFVDKAAAAKNAKLARIAARKEKARLAKENEAKAMKARYAEYKKISVAGKGHCRRPDCNCGYFVSGKTHAWCYVCFHSDLYHADIPTVQEQEKTLLNEELDAYEQAANESKVGPSVDEQVEETNEYGEPIIREPVPVEPEPEPVVVQEINAKLKVNRNPCSLPDCDCDRFNNNKAKYGLPMKDLIPRRIGGGFAQKEATPTETAIPSLPGVCRDCKHADFYHQPEEDDGSGKKKKKGGKKNK